ncbi:hypothetical protein KGM_207328 [Danaus plexippus plexippus]|uniref:Uncharacterized protein n=1 Tax=Danaus plexippus plexippus TaxID=278856 RepID=A0A212EHF1_DANPL|nr:hypothetical protein KGM_207328 [Danaus plexippus plexippus]
MDRVEQFRLIAMVISMASVIGYSYGFINFHNLTPDRPTKQTKPDTKEERNYERNKHSPSYGVQDRY